MTTDRTAREAMSSALKWISGILATIVTLAVIGAHGTLWSHESRLTAAEAAVQSTDHRMNRQDRKLEIIDQKLDRLLERRP